MQGQGDNVSNNIETGKKCPKCGAGGKWHGEHETAIRSYSFPWGAVGDVGWRCWNCGCEWGFEIQQGAGEWLVFLGEVIY